MNCPECDRLAREYELLIQEHRNFVDQYYAAVRASEVEKMWELRSRHPAQECSGSSA